MADEKGAVNTPEPGASATPDTQKTDTPTPASEETSRPVFTGKSIPYGRFKEVITERNEFGNRIKELENRLSTQEAFSRDSVTKGDNSKHLKKLVSAGMDEGLAQTFIESMTGATQDFLNERVAPLEQHKAQAEVKDWAERFSRTHKDYEELGPVMYEVYQKLPEEARSFFALNTEGLELLYSHAKMLKLQAEQEGNIQAGKDAAYATKGLKQAVTGTPGTAVNPQANAIKRGDVKDMSLGDYSKRREEILAGMRSGKVA